MFSWSWDSSFWRFVTEVESSIVSTGGVEGREGYVFGGLAIAFGLFRGRSWLWEMIDRVGRKSIGIHFSELVEILVKFVNVNDLHEL